MEDGIISVRYARALYSTAKEEKCEDEVYRELEQFSSNVFDNLERFHEVLENPVCKDEDKVQLIESAIDEPVCECLKQFFRFVVKQNRASRIFHIALKYQDMYRTDKNILKTKITTAAEMPEKTLKDITSFVEKTFGATVEAEVTVDPTLIGGFMLDIENKRLDASIRKQLAVLRESLVKKD